MTSAVIDFLLTRKTAPISELTQPGPSDEEIRTILQVASRVPDHGRLEPWRFILYRGEATHRIGEMLAELAEKREGPLPEARVEQEKARLSRAPLVIGVVSVPRENRKIPQWEMFLSGGAAAMNLVLATHALGYADPHQVSRDDLVALTPEAAAITRLPYHPEYREREQDLRRAS